MIPIGKQFILLLIILVLAGAYRLCFDLNPASVVFTQADEKAMDWIERNTPKDAVFLVQPYYWNRQLSAEDGGGWIEAITGRKVVFSDQENGDPSFLYFGQSSVIDTIHPGNEYQLLYTDGDVRIYQNQAFGDP